MHIVYSEGLGGKGLTESCRKSTAMSPVEVEQLARANPFRFDSDTSWMRVPSHRRRSCGEPSGGNTTNLTVV